MPTANARFVTSRYHFERARYRVQGQRRIGRPQFRPLPRSGDTWEPPAGSGIRLETHCYPGYVIPPFYDSLIAKLIVREEDRIEAVLAMQSALQDFQVEGVETTLPFLRAVTAHSDFIDSKVSTNWLEKIFMQQFKGEE